MNDTVKEYELGFCDGRAEVDPLLSLYRHAADKEEEEYQFSYRARDGREKAWTSLRDFLRSRGERILAIAPKKDGWSGEHKWVVLTELIAEAAKPAEHGVVAAQGHADPLFD